MADLHVVQNERGDYHVGFEAEGTFIPIAAVSAHRVAQLQERAASLDKLAEADDAASQERYAEAVAGTPYSVKQAGKSKANESAKGGTS